MSKFRTNVFSAATALSLTLFSVLPCQQAGAQNQRHQLDNTAPQPRAAARTAHQFEANELVIMVDPKADKGEVAQALQEANGTVEKTINFEGMQMLLVRTEPSKFAETELKLTKDRTHFSRVARNYLYQSTAASLIPYPNDPRVEDQWNLDALNVITASAIDGHDGKGVTIANLDSGAQGNIVELSGKVLPGLDLLHGGAANVEKFARDSFGNLVPHGTLTSSVMVANTNNKVGIAAVARGAKVDPYNIMNGSHTPDLFNIIAAISEACQKNERIIVLPIAATNPAYSLGNPNYAPSSFVQFCLYVHHIRKNGLAFLPTGVGGVADNNDRAAVPWMYFVSGINEKYQHDANSNYGKITSFTAPSTKILAVNQVGGIVQAFGTSLACVQVGAVAALAIADHPGYTNEQIIANMKKTCVNSTSGVNNLFGYGLPDADALIRL
jgi:hypothetical protein